MCVSVQIQRGACPTSFLVINCNYYEMRVIEYAIFLSTSPFFPQYSQVTSIFLILCRHHEDLQCRQEFFSWLSCTRIGPMWQANDGIACREYIYHHNSTKNRNQLNQNGSCKKERHQRKHRGKHRGFRESLENFYRILKSFKFALVYSNAMLRKL